MIVRPFGFAYLTPSQEEELFEAVKGKTVLDLGSGSGELSRAMADRGAKRVYAVDKSDAPDPHRGVTFLTGYFADLVRPEGAEVAVLSWPSNQTLAGLLRLLEGLPVLYLGKNTDGTACGNPGLFRYLSGRKVGRYLPSRDTSLLHYRTDAREDNLLFHEEFAGIGLKDEILRFRDSETPRTYEEWTRGVRMGEVPTWM